MNFTAVDVCELQLDIVQHPDEHPLGDRCRKSSTSVRLLVIPSFRQPLKLLVPLLLERNSSLLLMTVDMRYALRASRVLQT